MAKFDFLVTQSPGKMDLQINMVMIFFPNLLIYIQWN